MPSEHAILSASSSHRWLACPPSALACAKAEETSSMYAREGTEAHELCEYKVLTALGWGVEDPTPRLASYDEEMEASADAYTQFVMEQLAEAKTLCKDPLIFIEQRLNFSRWVPKGFGTGDCVILADDTLRIIDFKYGVGVLVEAEKNAQLMCYALGALHMFGDIYDIQQVVMTIFQPRREHVSTYTMRASELLSWADTVLKPAAQLAAKGEGEYAAGEHCRFCSIRSICRKRAEYSLEFARYDFAPPPTLEDVEIEAVLEKADVLAAWVGDVKEYALKEALSGKDWTGWKLVEGRSVRRYTDEGAVADAVIGAGLDPYEKKLLGITAMTKRLGKTQFEELLGSYVAKPQGKPVLVPMADKRPAMHIAAAEFKEEN